ncbi:MAG: hypothetical protein BA861_08005 [Desulfobacterales bacterium S3730MH5]|nr:MAG: hypothetical protein BA861_08005 [Desulfobacterales bacterium S3730MH5]
MEEYLYSPLIDTLLEWGKTKLLFPDHKEYLSLLEEGVGASSPADIGNELPIGVNTICAEAESGMETLSKPDLILATPDDSIWPEAEDGFLAFDRLVFLREALEYSTWSNESVLDITETYVKQVDEALQKVSDWLFAGEEFSALRLAALNEFRRKRLEDIPKDKEDLFAWYHLFTEDEFPLDWLIENFNLLQQETAPETLPEGIHLPVELYMAELRHDKILARVLEEEHRLSRGIQQAVVSSLALRLFTVSDLASMKYTLPPEVEAPGLSATAFHVISNAPRRTPADQLALVLQTGFCGPQLTDEQRLEAFSWVEEHIDAAIDYTGLIMTDSMLGRLATWRAGRTEQDDTQFADYVFSDWLEKLKSAAPIRTGESPHETIWSFLEGMMMAECEEKLWGVAEPRGSYGVEIPDPEIFDRLVGLSQNFIKRVEGFFRPERFQFLRPLQPAVALGALGTPEQDRMEEPLPELHGNLLVIDLDMPEDGGRVYLLLPQHEIKSDESDKLEQYLKCFKTFGKYWQAGIIFGANLPQTWKPDSLSRTPEPITQYVPKQTAAILIGLCSDEELLEKAIALVCEGKECTEESILWILYRPARKHAELE